MTSHNASLGPDTGAEGGVLLPKPPGVFRRFWARHPRLTDGLIAGVYTVPTILGAIAVSLQPGGPSWGMTVVRIGVAIVAGVVLFAFRRTRPWLVLAVAWAACLVVSPFANEALAVLLALYALGAYRSTRDAWIGYGVSVALSAGVASVPVVLAGTWLVPEGPTRPDAVGTFSQYVVLMLVAVLIGVTVGNRRRYLDALIARAHDLARERDQQARLAAADERARIAREMHDIVSHGLTVMITMAEGSAAQAPRDPERAAAIMRGVAETGREALGDMRRMLGVLTAAGDADAPAERHPQPDVAELPELVDGFRDAGLPVRLTTTGVAPADPALGLTIYRIAQEGLTNALRHGGRASRVDVGVTYRDGFVEIVVEDDAPTRQSGRDGSAPSTTGAGRGLTGVRERAALYGGTVEAGPRSGGGWRMRATLRTNESSE